MGVKYLNRHLVSNCKDEIVLTHMSELSGKNIVVDISIYLYKFQMSASLIENMYIMLSLFEKYQIIPIFIFDGKPPPEKRKMLNRRYAERVGAESEYTQLCEKLENEELNSREKRALMNDIQVLKRKCVYVTKAEIEVVQRLISAYGFTYCQAPSEADELCSLFVKKGIAWACLSEDMDMFVHATPRVLRYLSLINNTFVLYDTRSILNKLGVTQSEFIMLCVLSGTDYNIEQETNICELFQLFEKFKDHRKINPSVPFIDWAHRNEGLIVQDSQQVVDTMAMFSNTSSKCLSVVETSGCFRHDKQQGKIKEILEEDGFVYPVC